MLSKGIWVATFLATLTWSAIAPKDTLTWFLEVTPAVIAFILLILTRKHFPLTPLAYILILAHSAILMIGGHYTYAEVPLFEWLKEPMGWDRNNYDKVGHFAQGFIPALVAREIVIRKNVFNGKHWMNLFIICFCLGVSAFYELIEWWTALLSEEAAEAFLGTQGYVWDTQSDMMFAMIGAIAALITLSHWHDRQLQKIAPAPKDEK
jgi:putative membrane protein